MCLPQEPHTGPALLPELESQTLKDDDCHRAILVLGPVGWLPVHLPRGSLALVAYDRCEGGPVTKLLDSSSHTGMFLCPQGEKGEAGEKGDPGAEVGGPCSSFCVTPDKGPH